MIKAAIAAALTAALLGAALSGTKKIVSEQEQHQHVYVFRKDASETP